MGRRAIVMDAPVAAIESAWLIVALGESFSYGGFSVEEDAARARLAELQRAEPDLPWRLIAVPNTGRAPRDDPAAMIALSLAVTVVEAASDPHAFIPSAVRHAAYGVIEDIIGRMRS